MMTKKRKINFNKYVNDLKEKAKYKISAGPITLYQHYPYFSFRYYHITHKKFTHKGFTEKDFHTFFERIHKMSQHTWGDIFTRLKRFFHAHEVDWGRTAQKRGFCHLSRVLQDCPAYQFEIFKECRVFGFFNQYNIFKIVWIDRFHEVDPEH